MLEIDIQLTKVKVVMGCRITQLQKGNSSSAFVDFLAS